MIVNHLNDGARVFLTRKEYNQCLESAVLRVVIAIRLIAHSVRISTLCRIQLDDFETVETEHGTIYKLSVLEKDSSDSDSKRKQRWVWINRDLAKQILNFKDVDDFNSSADLFDLDSRGRFSTLINDDLAEDVATKTGNDDFLHLTSHDFRRYFVTTMLYRHRLPKDMVRQLGGWSSEYAMMQYINLPEDVWARELGERGLLGCAVDRCGPNESVYEFETATDSVQQAIEEADADTRRRLLHVLHSVFKDVDGVEFRFQDISTADGGGNVSDDDSGEQTSLFQL